MSRRTPESLTPSRTATALALVLLGAGSRLPAEELCARVAGQSRMISGGVALVAAEAATRRLIATAIEGWRQCPNYGTDFPELQATESAGELLLAGGATRVLQVEVFPGNSRDQRCGAFSGSRIRLYRTALNSLGQIRSCGSLDQNLAHELGHALGLADSLASERCEGDIMADLTVRNPYRRAVSLEDCRLVGQRWLTLSEWRSRSATSLTADAGLPAAAPAEEPAEVLPDRSP